MATAADVEQRHNYRVPHGFFSSGLSEDQARGRGWHPRGAAARADPDRADRVREYRQQGGPRSAELVLTNKYAEGYPGRRYYQGCAPSDTVETLAIERAKKLFGCEFANDQPHSGAQANGAVMMALLKPGDTIMGLSLAAGGHLTHGAPPAQSGKWFNAVHYGVRPERPPRRLR